MTSRNDREIESIQTIGCGYVNIVPGMELEMLNFAYEDCMKLMWTQLYMRNAKVKIRNEARIKTCNKPISLFMLSILILLHGVPTIKTHVYWIRLLIFVWMHLSC